jgi:hypothetical protein
MMSGQIFVLPPAREGFRWVKEAAEIALHPSTDNDDYRIVTFLDEATRQTEMIDAAQ